MSKSKPYQTEEPPISSPVPVTLPATLSDRARRILADNRPLSPEDWFILTQLHLICLFRRTKKISKKAKFFKYISRRQAEGLEIGLTSQDFLDLNQWVKNQDLAGNLEGLVKRVKERKRLEKRAAKKLKTKTGAK